MLLRSEHSLRSTREMACNRSSPGVRVGHAAADSKEAASAHHGNHSGSRGAKAHRTTKKNGHETSGVDLDLEARCRQSRQQRGVFGSQRKLVRSGEVLAGRGGNHDRLLAYHHRPDQCVLLRVRQQYRQQISLRLIEVVTLIAEGFSLKLTASILGLSVKTVEYHWRACKAKLGFRSYADAVRYAIKNNLIKL